MPGGENILNRMLDVLLALDEAEEVRVQPTRIQLQKFVYLADVLSQVMGALKLGRGHRTYTRGPYDAAIQNAVDSLAFRGLVRVAGVWRMPGGGVGAKYQLSGPGRRLLSGLREMQEFRRKVAVARIVGTEIGKIGWSHIVEMVYAEPTYVTVRAFGWGQDLEVENGLHVSAAFLFAIMRRSADIIRNRDDRVSAEWLGDRFFAYLKDYDRHYVSAPTVAA